MHDKDYYKTLGVAETADSDEIKRAFRKLAATMHPDKNPDDPTAEQRFKEINEAYQTLSDKDKRAEYDMRQSGAFASSFSGYSGGFSSVMDEMFNEMFNRQSPRQSDWVQPGNDVELRISLTLEEALAGGKKEVIYRVDVACDACSGMGSDGPARMRKCDACKGSGIRKQVMGLISFTTPCAACKGRGEEVENRCPSCNGAGSIQRKRAEHISFPPGIDDGDILRVSGAGHAGAVGRTSGDLFIAVSIEKHPRFMRRGRDLVTAIDASISELVLGGERTIDGLNGTKHRITIPPRTLPNSTIMMHGEGCFRHGHPGRGSLHVVVNMQMPSEISPDAEQKLREFDELSRSG